jgi:4-oxalocrotonate tautomerase
MPLIQVSLARGRTPEQLRALGDALTATVEDTLGVERSTVRVVEPDHWFVGGETLAERRAPDRPTAP